MRRLWFVVRAVVLHANARLRCALRGHDDIHCADVGQRRRWVHCLRCGRNSLGIRTPEPPRPHVMQDQHRPSTRRRLAKLQQRYQVR